MGNSKKYNWKEYFYSRINGDYSKTHKNILNLVDERLKKIAPYEYPNIHFNWLDISDLYEECRQEYFGLMNSESKRTFNDGKLVIDGMSNSIFSYSPVYDARACNDIVNNIFRLSRLPNIELELVHWNKDKDCVYVKLADGRSTIVKRYGDTKDDIYAAVAYALAKIEFETNSNFKKEVDSCLVILDSKKGKKNGK